MDATNERMNVGANQEAPVWETPSFVEIRMDAEVGSYQDDFESEDWH
jgi:hypothetical protein